MFVGIWNVFLTLLGRALKPDDPEDDHRFVPSPLDLCVRVGHGGRDDELHRELSKLDERARELDERQREHCPAG